MAFLDILGTSNRVRNDQFDDIEIFDFVNPVCLLAYHIPSLRCAAFSDSVVISAPENDIENLLIGLSYLFSQWISDCVFVRGGLALGEIVWVDMDRIDSRFRKLENLAFARVYGNGLLNAQETEKGSGPGAVCFLSPRVSGLIRAINANLVLQGPVDVLVWASKRINRFAQNICSGRAEEKNLDSDVSRQMAATAWYYREMERLGLFTPPGMVPFSPEINEEETRPIHK